MPQQFPGIAPLGAGIVLPMPVALIGVDYENATTLCTADPIADWANSDVDNGTDSICTDAPSFDDPAFDPGVADYDNADVTPRHLINQDTAGRIRTPVGWLLCDGRAFNPAQYPELYAVIGTRYGGTAAAPLVPDLQGRFPRCVSASHALGSTQGWATRGPSGGLTITTEGEHAHGKGALATTSLAAHYHLEPHRETNQSPAFGIENGASVSHRYNARGQTGSQYLNTETTGAHSHKITLQGNGAHSHGVSGGDNETAPPNYAMPFIISTGGR